jgi:transposase
MKAKFPEETEKKMKELLIQEKSGSEVRKIQVILLGSQGKTAKEIESITLYKESYIRFLWMRYRKEGTNIFENKKTQTRNKAYLSTEEEIDFLAPFLERAKKAGILIVSDIHKELEERIGKKIREETTYKLLHRHGWRKIVPRPYHPKRDSEKRDKWLNSFPPGDKKSSRGG